MANFWGNFVSLMGVPGFYFQNLVILFIDDDEGIPFCVM
jgi:hypothetical protein